MKNLNDELQSYFTNLNIGQCMKLESLPEDAVAWVLMDSYQTILVAIPCSENLEFNENFAGVAMRTTIRDVHRCSRLLAVADQLYLLIRDDCPNCQFEDENGNEFLSAGILVIAADSGKVKQTCPVRATDDSCSGFCVDMCVVGGCLVVAKDEGCGLQAFAL